jgi:hypothetical protein
VNRTQVAYLLKRIDWRWHCDNKYVGLTWDGASYQILFDDRIVQEFLHRRLIEVHRPIVDSTNHILVDIDTNNLMAGSRPHECRRKANISRSDHNYRSSLHL